MKTNDLNAALMRMLDKLEADAPFSPEDSEARALLADLLSYRAAHGSVSTAKLAAYASGTMSEDERHLFEEEMASSSETFDEVTSALNFLKRVEAQHETAPPDLVEAVIASRPGSAAPVNAGPSPGKTSSPLLTRSHIERFFREGVPLSADQQQQLFTNPALRAEFERVKNEFAAHLPSGDIFEMPKVAAAATSEKLTKRRFPGADLELEPSRRPQRILVILTLDSAVRETPPQALVLKGKDEIEWLELPKPDRDGKIQLVLDDPQDAKIIRLLGDRETTGTFVPPSGSAGSL